jgi:SagB-type dehydrogenase family enzyme
LIGIGDKFQQETKYHRNNINGGISLYNKPDLYKTYPKCKRILLPNYKAPSVDLDEVIKNRKSIRNFSDKPLSIEQISYLLWASTGIQRKENNYEYRTAPSAGALYPIETYLVINNVEKIPKGIYHYNIKDHLIEELKQGDFRKHITHAALEQQMCYNAALVFIWTAIFDRSKSKYNQRAFRYIYLDVGHIAENLALASTGLRLASCHIAALFDDEVNQIINVDGKKESTIYMTVMGNLKE